MKRVFINGHEITENGTIHKELFCAADIKIINHIEDLIEAMSEETMIIYTGMYEGDIINIFMESE